jgi:uncharacterized membrane protein HdeD (DUF308 family)
MSTSTPSESEGKAKKNTQATAGLILGIISFLTPFLQGICVPQLAGILAIIAGIMGIQFASKSDGQGRSLAIGGLVVGGIGLLISIVLFALSVQRGIQGG